MISFIARRAGWTLLVLWITYTISFTLMALSPGGPFTGERAASQEIKKNLEARYGLNQPFHVRYSRGLWAAMRGDFGPSMTMEDFTVNDIVSAGFSISSALGLTALGIALALGLAAGTIAAARRQKAADRVGMLLATLGIALPLFVLASLAILVFVFYIPLFPAAGWGTPEQLVLPAVCLGLPYAAYIARLMRSSLLDVLSQDYIRTARAKGLTGSAVVIKHGMRAAILPVVSFLGPATAGILAGSLVIERIFAIPGIGVHLVDAAFKRDYTLAMGMILLYAVLLCGMNLFVDIMLAVLDPRVKLDS